MSADIRNVKDCAPNEATIRHCEKLLELAKSGRLRSMLIVMGWDDDAISHCWSMDKRNGRRRFLGGIELAKFDFLTDTAAGDSDFRLSQIFNGEG